MPGTARLLWEVELRAYGFARLSCADLCMELNWASRSRASEKSEVPCWPLCLLTHSSVQNTDPELGVTYTRSHSSEGLSPGHHPALLPLPLGSSLRPR